MNRNFIKKCNKCGKTQEGKKEGYYILLTGTDCECGGIHKFTFTNS